ncbi:MAG: hypothetical protein WBQ52_04610 [Terracidiphilus sp.]
MEIFLNLAWAALSIYMVWTWLRVEDGTDRRRRIVALAVLVAILLPAISISDDLLAMQNATEIDTCVRRQQLVSNGAHPLARQVAATFPPAHPHAVTVENVGFAPPPAAFVLHSDLPGLRAIQGRAPPAA